MSTSFVSPNNIIKVYLAHYNSIELIEIQVNLIRKFFKYDTNKSKLELYGFVDSPDLNMQNTMRNTWKYLDVIPINLPSNRDKNAAASYGLAFQYIYNNYIKDDTYISIFIENDVLPISDINPGATNTLYLNASLFANREIDCV
jgi:hypothetical protein